MTPRYPDIQVHLVGGDGNAFAILGTVQGALKAAKVDEDIINEFLDEAMSGDYNHLLRTVQEWVDVA